MHPTVLETLYVGSTSEPCRAGGFSWQKTGATPTTSLFRAVQAEASVMTPRHAGMFRTYRSVVARCIRDVGGGQVTLRSVVSRTVLVLRSLLYIPRTTSTATDVVCEVGELSGRAVPRLRQ